MNATESARRHALRERGVGASREAILARRAREQRNQILQIGRGERLPGWVAVGLATEAQVDQLITTLTPSARKNAMDLLRNFGTEALEPEAPSE